MSGPSALVRALLDNPNFVKWFGKSAVRDAEGLPLEVYHGTTGSFDAFDPRRLGGNTDAESSKLGFYFTSSPRVAQSYADYSATQAPVARVLKEAEKAERRGKWDLYDKKILEAEQLEAKFDDPANRLAGQGVVPAYLKMDNPFVYDAQGEMYSAIEGGLTSKLRQARAKGHDGAIVKNLDDAAGLSNSVADHYLVFNPTQVKSRFNRGTFDPTDPSFLKSLAPVAAGGGLLAAMMTPQESQAATMGISPGKLARMLTAQYNDTARRQAVESDPILDPIGMGVNAATGGGGALARGAQAALDPVFNWMLR